MKEIVIAVIVIAVLASLVGAFALITRSEGAFQQRSLSGGNPVGTIPQAPPAAPGLADANKDRIIELELTVERLMARIDKLEDRRLLASADGTIDEDDLKRIIQEQRDSEAKAKYKKHLDRAKKRRHEKVDRFAKQKGWSDSVVEQIKALLDEEADKKLELYDTVAGGDYSNKTYREEIAKLSAETFKAIEDLIGLADAKLLHYGYYYANRNKSGAEGSGETGEGSDSASRRKDSMNRYYKRAKDRRDTRIDKLATKREWDDDVTEQVKEILDKDSEQRRELHGTVRSGGVFSSGWGKDYQEKSKEIIEETESKLKELLGDEGAKGVRPGGWGGRIRPSTGGPSGAGGWRNP